MARTKPHLNVDELPSVVTALRQLAARLADKPSTPLHSKESQAQGERLYAAQVEAGRLILAAREAGGFADCYGLDKVITQCQDDTDREACGTGQDHLEFFRLGVCLGVVETWMPERWEDSILGAAKSPDQGDDYNECRYYAANFNILANKIEAIWTLAQPSGFPLGGPGNADQGKARPARENAPEKVSGAGAQSAISTNANGAETPDKVRTGDLNPELLEMGEAVRKQLADSFSKIEGLDFQQTRERLISKCREFRQYVEDAQPGHEFDDTLPLQFETCWLARRLSFGAVPVAVTHTRETIAELFKRLGIRDTTTPDLAGPASVDPTDIHLATVNLPYGGRTLTLPVAMYCERDGELVGAAHEPLPDESRRKLLSRFDKWITAAGNCLPSDFRPDVRPAKTDYLNAIAIFTAECILLWHAPKAQSPSAPPNYGAPMPETTESLPAGEAGQPISLACQIERLIADAENWMRPRTVILSLGERPSEEWRKENEIQEHSRVNAVQDAKLIATELVQLNESARAVLTVLNSLKTNDCNKARNDWPALKVELQEAAIRVRLKDDVMQAAVGVANKEDLGEARPESKPRRGRKELSRAEAEKRQAILKRWEQAQGAGISRKDFCHDANITLDYLEKCQEWRRQREKHDQ